MQATETSAMGIAFLERHEGVVLKAYRDPAGVWTIGPGLTRASGVVEPKPGMTITREESSRLTRLALKRSYEPRVHTAMQGANQQEIDAGVSFDWNTGAIHRAGWVKSWRGRDWPAVQRRLAEWRKGGGKVLPGLVRRRAEEFELMRYGEYGGATAPAGGRPVAAVVALDLDRAEIEAARAAFRTLGYDPGTVAGEIDRNAVLRFQRDHDLTADGIVGRATLSTLQRRIDARAKAAAPAATGVAGAAGAEVSGLPEWVVPLVLAAAALIALRLAWTYRDVIAAKVQGRAPGLAAWLRSF